MTMIHNIVLQRQPWVYVWQQDVEERGRDQPHPQGQHLHPRPQGQDAPANKTKVCQQANEKKIDRQIQMLTIHIVKNLKKM